ncbi:MAG: MFS transporter [Nitriliruptoraceae bacterium]
MTDPQHTTERHREPTTERRLAPPEPVPEPGRTAGPPQPAPPRSGWKLLADPVFGPFFAGKAVSTAGIWVHNIVAAILAWELSRSALVVGLVSVAQFGPQLLFAPLSGAHADRGDRRLQLVVGRLIAAGGSLGLAIWVALAGVDGLPGAWPVVATALVVGTGFVVGGPAMNALVPSLVRPEELATAIAVNSVPFTVARAAGPALGAVLATSLGPASAFALAGASNLLFALLLVRLPIQGRSHTAGHGDRRVRAGLAYLRKDRAIVLLLVGVASIGLGADPVITLTPSLAASLGGEARLVGVFASTFGVGAGLAFVVLTRLRVRFGLERLAVAGLLLLASGMVLAGLAPVLAGAVGGFLVAGSGMTLALTSLSTQLQARLPDELRGRVMALWSVAFLGSRPLAAAANGALADLTSPAVAMLGVGVLVALTATVIRPARLAARPVPSRAVLSPASRS